MTTLYQVFTLVCGTLAGTSFVLYEHYHEKPGYVWLPLVLLGWLLMDLRGWLKYNPKITGLGIELANHVKYRKILESKLGLESNGDRVTDRLAELGETFEARK